MIVFSHGNALIWCLVLGYLIRMSSIVVESSEFETSQVLVETVATCKQLYNFAYEMNLCLYVAYSIYQKSGNFCCKMFHNIEIANVE